MHVQKLSKMSRWVGMLSFFLPQPLYINFMYSNTTQGAGARGGSSFESAPDWVLSLAYYAHAHKMHMQTRSTQHTSTISQCTGMCVRSDLSLCVVTWQAECTQTSNSHVFTILSI